MTFTLDKFYLGSFRRQKVIVPEWVNVGVVDGDKF